MRQQVRWAKQAGIEGFLVSWKHTPTLDRRLTQLVEIAEQEHFRLGVVTRVRLRRQPLPADRAATDLDYFATSPVGRRHDLARPLVVWSGTWKFNQRTLPGHRTTTRR
jgi:hypothetical protein